MTKCKRWDTVAEAEYRYKQRLAEQEARLEEARRIRDLLRELEEYENEQP